MRGRFGKFVDMRTIQRRMDEKDARIARELAARHPVIPVGVVWCQACGAKLDPAGWCANQCNREDGSIEPKGK